MNEVPDENNIGLLLILLIVFFAIVCFFFWMSGPGYQKCDAEHYPELQGNYSNAEYHYFKSWSDCCYGDGSGRDRSFNGAVIYTHACTKQKIQESAP